MAQETLSPPAPSVAPPTAPSPGPNAPAGAAGSTVNNGRVSFRAFGVGLFLTVLLSAVNTWMETQANVHFFGGVQMPFGAIFALLFMIVLVNGPLRLLQRTVPAVSRVLPPFAPAELLTMYAMMIFGALISTPGTESFFLTTGPTLFYFSTPQNKWADTFYSLIPRHFAPGWDGKTYQKEVIDAFYTGGITKISDIPWHAWTTMLIAWSIFLLLVYAALFFFSLLLRRQWIENEALAFPLVQLPIQMVDTTAGPVGTGFWSNRTMWTGMVLACGFHFLRGMNYYFPDWPMVSAFQGNAFPITFTENPWSAIGTINTELFFGAIGISYLLTRELSFSFWFFFLLFRLQLVAVTMLGYPADTLPKDLHLGRPAFLTWQSTGGWMMMGALLLWTARGHVQTLFRQAINPNYIDPRHSDQSDVAEPFSARFILGGMVLSSLGILGWCMYSGINPIAAVAFFTIYGLTSLVLARLVVEGGFIFPQLTYSTMEVLTGAFMNGAAIGKESITRLSYIQPMLFADMRTNLLPGFLHTLKISHDLKMSRRDTRRLMLAIAVSIVASLAVMSFTNIVTLYNYGGLAGYTWFTRSGGEAVFRGAATMIKSPPTVQASNWGWMALGGALVWGMMFARSRFLWFPFHPLGYIVSSSFPITRLWTAFFVGWLIKAVLLRFGGQESAARARPFMIGLILGNSVAMVLWLIYGWYVNNYIKYWPA